jgi:hypothetical protein
MVPEHLGQWHTSIVNHSKESERDDPLGVCGVYTWLKFVLYRFPWLIKISTHGETHRPLIDRRYNGFLPMTRTV